MLITTKKIKLTQHAKERFEQRKHELRPAEKRAYKEKQERYIVSLLAINNIKSQETKDGSIFIKTKQNYHFVIRETPTTWIVKTIYLKRNPKKF